MNPTFIMMVGLPYSGKSYYAEKLSKEYGAVVHSSDAIRAEILGDVQDQNNNGKVFEVLHRRVYDDLSNGKSVIYDATNINYKRRMDAIQRLKRIPCEKVCYLMATPFSECVERSKCRERVVPYEVLERMYKSIWIPQYYEGWDRIEIVYPDGFKTLDTKELFWGENGLAWINQDNPHHNLTVGAHCIATYANIHGGSPELYEAAMLHDIGKPFTKAFKNSKGEDSDIAHYYDHHHVSAYDSLFYISPALDVLYVVGLIQWHMRPFELERVPKSKKALDKFKRLIGEKMYNDVMVLHEADIKAKGADAEDAA